MPSECSVCPIRCRKGSCRHDYYWKVNHQYIVLAIFKLIHPWNFQKTVRRNYVSLQFSNRSRTAMTEIYPCSGSMFGIDLSEALEQQRSNWLPSIFPQHCAVGATFPSTPVLFVPVKKKKPCIRTSLVLTQPRPQVQLHSRCAPCLCALLPSRSVTTICSLAQPSAPRAGQTQSADTLTPNTRGEEVRVCGCSVVIHTCGATIRSQMWGWKEHHNVFSNTCSATNSVEKKAKIKWTLTLTHPVTRNIFIVYLYYYFSSLFLASNAIVTVLG